MGFDELCWCVLLYLEKANVASFDLIGGYKIRLLHCVFIKFELSFFYVYHAWIVHSFIYTHTLKININIRNLNITSSYLKVNSINK